VIDWARVDQLRDEVGDEAFAEIAAMFVAEAEAAVSRLHDRMAAATLAAELHGLKGSALNLGFADLARLSAAGEAAAAAGHPQEVDLTAVKRAFADARAAFVARVPQAG